MVRSMLVTSVALMGLLTVPAGARQASLYDLPHEGFVSGTIESVSQRDICPTSKDGSCRECDCCKGTDLCQGVHLVVKTGQRKLDVYVGPWWFVQRNELEFPVGSQAIVLGARIRLPLGTMLLAREITIGSTTVKLRDNMGRPLWLERFTE